MTPDDRAPEPPQEPAAPPVPGPPAVDPSTANDSASWGTTASPVYAAGGHDTQPLPRGGYAAGRHDTLPIATGVGMTQPLATVPPAPPAVVPGHPAASAAPPVHGTPPTPPGPPTAPGYGAAPGYGTPPGHGAGPGYGPGPGYGTPPGTGVMPGYGTPPGAPVRPYGWTPPVPTDGLAVASLVTSAGGLLLLAGLTGPIGVGLGIGALVRIRRTRAPGRGLAIAGIAVGAVGTVVIALLTWLVIALVQWGNATAQQATDTFGGQDELGKELEGLLEDLGSGSGSAPGDLFGEDLFGDLGEEGKGTGTLPPYALPQDVAVGTCWQALPEYYDLSDAVVVPCTDLHDVEVVAHVTPTGAPATDLTAEDPVLAEALDRCEAAVAAIDPGLLVWGAVDVWLPHPDQVAAGQLVGYCVHEDTFGRTDSLVAPSGVAS
ncbi:DUF4190 domain-containing protein [Cellulomonas wangsupingiae]|uniref:DUF4190 domain-containing protein n=1 Tax=Cellulomonas wangsupingiae TaxID=2968085 RepID=UPI001D0F1C88|nr:DUF4190 domain-containing protein [Cellulomonas wangsupingiae]MCM0640661.1 DUF4190 domain-containing protein [Cellulomonas wangsupingiae]